MGWKIVIAAALGVIGASAAAEDWREGPAFFEADTLRQKDEISGCLAEAWEKRSGATQFVPTKDGFSMQLVYSIFGQPLTAAKVVVADDGTRRKVTVRARKGDRSDKLRAEVTSCL
jgi:hypothetical protein